MKYPAAAASLKHRDFRLIWFGQFVSTVGTQVQTVALAWLVYSITGSAAALGVVGLARAIPTILLSLFGGTLADQVDRRRLLIVSQSILATFSALLAIAVSLGVTNLVLLYGFAVITSAASAFDNPTRQAIIPALVPRDLLANALTVNVLANNTASVIGPAIGGIVLSALGASTSFWIDGASFVVVVAALLIMRERPPIPVPTRRGLPALVDGLQFLKDRSILWQLMLIDFLAMLFASTLGLLPVFANSVFNAGPRALGFLYSAPSVGSVLGAMLFSMIPLPRFPGRVVAIAIGAYGLSLALFGISSQFYVALLLLAAAGMLDAVSMATRQTVRQLATPNEFRGRIGAVSSMFSAGGPRLGDFQSGLIASVIGPRSAMVFGGGACCVMAMSSVAWARRLWSYRGEEEVVSLAGDSSDVVVRSAIGPTRDD
ncbi:MAG TPA: MFS transporter [Nitrolancea sp.]|nr:MFS transporter [Nitrolancea sp.]